MITNVAIFSVLLTIQRSSFDCSHLVAFICSLIVCKCVLHICAANILYCALACIFTCSIESLIEHKFLSLISSIINFPYDQSFLYSVQRHFLYCKVMKIILYYEYQKFCFAFCIGLIFFLFLLLKLNSHLAAWSQLLLQS